ncbi:hypothetical protein BC833DRAFT_359437 [Globomyces pollinis-pini]|nr:hypothetical protein BC833DRAFT_359437 [Globomyces pollinis-pini]
MSNDLQDFQKELKTLGDKIPVSASKIGSITKLAMKYISDSNQIVEIISSFIKQCKPEVKLGAMYLIDSICRASQKLSESENLYPKNFEIVLPDLFWELTKCPPKDKDKMKRVLHLWISSNILSIDVLKKINKVHFEGFDHSFLIICNQLPNHQQISIM